MKGLKSKLLCLGLGTLLLSTVPVFGEEKKMDTPKEEIKYGDICGITGYVEDGDIKDVLIKINLKLEDGPTLECYFPNWPFEYKEGTFSPVDKEYLKDLSESGNDLEKVTGYTKNGIFYMKELEINGKTFKFE